MCNNSYQPIFLNAAVLVNNSKPLKFMKLKIPKLKKGQVLVKLIYSGVCGSQIMEIDGLRGKDKYLPHLLGHEGYGKVVSIGKSVKKVRSGQKVILSWIKSSGINAEAPVYKSKNRIINAGQITTFSDYSIISENRLTLAPKNIDPLNAVLFGCAIPTGAGMIFNQLEINSNSSIALFGVGGIGLFSLIACKILKAKKIIAIDINDKKLNLAKKFGATHLINIKKDNLIKKILEFNNNEMVDYAVDSAGKVETIEMSFSIIKNSGTTIFASHPKFNKKIKIDPFDLIKGKKLFGSWGGNSKPDIDIKKFYSKFIKNKINFKSFTTDIYEFKNLNLAVNDLRNKKVFRPIIKF